MGGPVGTHTYERLSATVDRFVIWLEKDHLPLFGVFLFVLTLSLIRDLLEYFLLDPNFVTTEHPWIFSIAHHVAFYVLVFQGLVLLLSAFSGRGIRKSINFVSTFYWVIVLPPILDYLAGNRQNYAYLSWTDFINAFFHFSGAAFHIGQAVEVGVVIFLLFAYSIWIQRQNLFSVRDRAITFGQIGLLIVFTFVSLFLVATPEAYLPVAPQNFPQFDTVKYYQWHFFLFSYYLMAGVLVALAISYLATRPRFRGFIRSIRPSQTLFFAAIVAAGIVTGWKDTSNLDLVTKIFQTPYWVNLAFAGVSIIAALMAWQVSTIWNDLSDRISDDPRRRGRLVASGTVSPQLMVQISLLLAMISVTCGFLLSAQMGIIVLMILLLSYFYSFKPIRFKDHALSPILLGLGAYMAFLFGYLTPCSEIGFVTAPGISIPILTGAVISAPLTTEAFYIGFFMFLGIMIGSIVTDIDGFQEDSRARVKTIYTILGLEKGKKIAAALILIGGLTPLFIFNNTQDYVIFPILAATASLAFMRSERSRPVLYIALIGLVYAATQYLFS